jgi:hypothetical protein
MTGLNDPYYVQAANNARIAERPGVALEQLARDARRESAEPRSHRLPARLVLAAWARIHRPRSQPVDDLHREPDKATVSSARGA